MTKTTSQLPVRSRQKPPNATRRSSSLNSQSTPRLRRNTRCVRKIPPTVLLSSPRRASYSPVSESPSGSVVGPSLISIGPSYFDTQFSLHTSSTSSLPPLPTSLSCNDIRSTSLPSDVSTEELSPCGESSVRTLTNVDLYQILRKQTHLYSDVFITVLRKLTDGIERDTINMSERFQLLVLRWNGSFIWFTCVDDEPFVFALSNCEGPDDLIVYCKDECESIPCISLPSYGITWIELQQNLVKRFKEDGHVRAILAACMLSYEYQGKYVCVLEKLLPTALRQFTTPITYNVPIDLDILLVLANPYLTENDDLFFESGENLCASVKNMRNDCIFHLESIIPPTTRKPYIETSSCLLPYRYGFGTIMNRKDDDPTRTTEIGHLINRLGKIGKKDSTMYKILKLATFASPRKALDLTEAATMISKWEGGILPGSFGANPFNQSGDERRGTLHRAKKFIRRITGDVIVIGNDGLYKSSRFHGAEVEGGLEIDIAIIKLGCKAKREVSREEDVKITCLSQVAAYIMGEDYVPMDNCDNDMPYVPHFDDMWNDEVAIVNTFAALLCRRFGMFAGFSSFASSPRYLGSLHGDSMTPQMEADIFLPVLHVFVDPRHQWPMVRSGVMLSLSILVLTSLGALLMHNQRLALFCLLLTYVVIIFFAVWNLDDLEEAIYRRMLVRASPWLKPLERNVGVGNRRWNLLIHNNPYANVDVRGKIPVFGHHCTYIDRVLVRTWYTSFTRFWSVKRQL